MSELGRRRFLGGCVALALPGCSTALPHAPPIPRELLLERERVSAAPTLRLVSRLEEEIYETDVVDRLEYLVALWFVQDPELGARALFASDRIDQWDEDDSWLVLSAVIPRAAFDAPMMFATRGPAIAWLEPQTADQPARLAYAVVGPLVDAPGGARPARGYGDSIPHEVTSPLLLDVLSDDYGVRTYLFGDERGVPGVVEIGMDPLRPRRRFTALPGARGANVGARAAIRGRGNDHQCVYAVNETLADGTSATRILAAPLAAGPWEGRAPSVAREVEITRERGRCLGVFATAKGWLCWLVRDEATFRVSAQAVCVAAHEPRSRCVTYPIDGALGGATDAPDPIAVTPTESGLALLFETAGAWVVLAQGQAFALERSAAPSAATPTVAVGTVAGVRLVFPHHTKGLVMVKLERRAEPGVAR